MGSRGPQPKPTYLRLLENNPSGKPFNPDEVKVPLVKTLKPPGWFTPDKTKIWEEVCDELAAMKGLSSVVYQLLVLYVDTLCENKRLIQKMQGAKDSVYPTKYGLDENGKKVPIKLSSVPWYNQLIAQKKLALVFATHFGMTPSARARIVFLGSSADDGRDEDPFN